jgi:glyoxylase-like metal-dependent hydrolase (beta-lactamase superfamily II)
MEPVAATAEVHVLLAGYVGGRVASIVTLVRDGDLRLVVDPGMVPGRAAILEPLEGFGVVPGDVTDVVIS